MGYKNIGDKLNISNKSFAEEIVQSISDNKLTDKVVDYFVKLACHAIRKLPFRDPRDKEDCIQSALLDLSKYWRNFDIKYSNNAFAYFTQMAKNGYAKEFKKIHKNSFTKRYNIFQWKEQIMPIPELIADILESLDEDFNKIVTKRSIRYLKDKATDRWSNWIDLDFTAEDAFLGEPYSFQYPIVVEFKYEYKEGYETISLDYGGEQEIYTI